VTAPELLATLHARGIRVRVVGDQLGLTPPEVVTPELLAQVRELKPEIIAALTAPGFTTPAACGWCGKGLLPVLVTQEGRSSMFCEVCRRWTVPGGAV
jgi:hypothetical protein